MNKMIALDIDCTTGLKNYLKELLNNGKVSSVFSLRRLKNGKVDYGLITQAELIDKIEPFYPLMPANAGQLLGRFTPLGKPIAAVVRPCEFRAFVEMVKREQVKRENFIIITYSCGGVYPLKINAVQEIDNVLADYQQQVQSLEIPDGIRPACTGCEHINPLEADIFISVAGAEDDSLQAWLRTDIARSLAGFWHTETMDSDFNESILEPLLAKRKAAKEELFAGVNTQETGLNGLIDLFGRCIGCHGCNSVCPICYCTLCDFDSFNYDYNRQILEKELEQKGAIRLPPDTLFFHLGRLSHMSFSCVGCGMCSDVCPANIPVAAVFKKIGEETAGMFDFVSGRSVAEEIPVMIYKEEEFPELGE
ncbi:MAG: 4Fe-4S dicluster domain-containing protein [Candidatus Cloacimonetes bacterium]|nr:4Fe-4S dicluster domain-containing protein [Candidatus Cloacimonadota bacterium]